MTSIDVIVVTHNSARHISAFLHSLRTQTWSGKLNIVIVDNSSTDSTIEVANATGISFSLVQLSQNLGYACALNAGAAAGQSPVIVFANADVVLDPNVIEAIKLGFDKWSNAAVIGGQQRYPSGEWQRSYGPIPSWPMLVARVFGVWSVNSLFHRMGWRSSAKIPKRVGYIDGALLAVTRKAFDELHGFDERFPFYCEELDFCYRAHRAGFDCLHLPTLTFVHVRGGSSTRASNDFTTITKYSRILADARATFYKKWYSTPHVFLCIALEITECIKRLAILPPLLLPQRSRGYAKVQLAEYGTMCRAWLQNCKCMRPPERSL